MRLPAACRVNGGWGVVENSSGEAASSSSATPPRTTSHTTKNREKQSGIIISALGEAALLVFIEANDDPAKIDQASGCLVGI